MKTKFSTIFIFTILIAMALSSCSSLIGTDNSSSEIKASGTISAPVVNVASEISGKVNQVDVAEGDSVNAGDVLFKLDCNLYDAQYNVSQIAVDSANNAFISAQNAEALAQAQYDATLTEARAQDSTRLADWDKRTPDYFEQPNWYFSREEQISAAQVTADLAKQALEDAKANLDHTTESLENADFVAAETRLSQARTNYLIAKTVDSQAQITGGDVSPADISATPTNPYIPTYRFRIAVAHVTSGDSDILDKSQDYLDTAKDELDDAEKEYDALLYSKAADRVLEVRAELSVAQERYNVALDTLNQLQVGEYSQQVKIASLALDQAKDGVQHAQDAINQAQASLELIDLQLEKCTVKAPQAGIVSSSNLESGEMVTPGGTVMVISQINTVDVTVYIPEDRYGQINLGQQVSISVDSFPGQTFTGTVQFISSEAEFTPRNVQTEDGRKTTVYAVKIEVPNENNLLKPGMPVDVEFLQSKNR